MSLIEGFQEGEPTKENPIPWRAKENASKRNYHMYRCSCGATFTGRGHYKTAKLHADTMGHRLKQGSVSQ